MERERPTLESSASDVEAGTGHSSSAGFDPRTRNATRERASPLLAPLVETPKTAEQASLNPVWARSLRVLALATCDLLALWTSGIAAYLLWARPVRHQDPALYIGLAPLFALLIAGYLAADLYPGFGLGPVESLRRTWLVTGFG